MYGMYSMTVCMVCMVWQYVWYVWYDSSNTVVEIGGTLLHRSLDPEYDTVLQYRTPGSRFIDACAFTGLVPQIVPDKVPSIFHFVEVFSCFLCLFAFRLSNRERASNYPNRNPNQNPNANLNPNPG